MREGYAYILPYKKWVNLGFYKGALLIDKNRLLEETENGSGKFTEVTLNPKVKITYESRVEKANELHEEANKMCFIANSCNFKIRHKPNTIAV